MAQLQQAGLIKTQRGKGGGSVLARSAEDISLKEVFEVVCGEAQLVPRHPGDGEGAVAPILADYVNDLYAEAERAFFDTLGGVSVAGMDRTVRLRIYEALDCGEALDRGREGPDEPT